MIIITPKKQVKVGGISPRLADELLNEKGIKLLYYEAGQRKRTAS